MQRCPYCSNGIPVLECWAIRSFWQGVCAERAVGLKVDHDIDRALWRAAFGREGRETGQLVDFMAACLRYWAKGGG